MDFIHHGGYLCNQLGSEGSVVALHSYKVCRTSDLHDVNGLDLLSQKLHLHVITRLIESQQQLEFNVSRLFRVRAAAG